MITSLSWTFCPFFKIESSFVMHNDIMYKFIFYFFISSIIHITPLLVERMKFDWGSKIRLWLYSIHDTFLTIYIWSSNLSVKYTNRLSLRPCSLSSTSPKLFFTILLKFLFMHENKIRMNVNQKFVEII